MTDKVDTFLAHYGVKGMHWGVRRASRGPTPVTVTTRPGKPVKTSGGTGLPASKDAKVAAKARQKAKSSSVDSLSNDELQALVKRMNLEQQLSDLSAKRMSGGKKFVTDLFKDVGKQQSKRAGNMYAAERIDAMMKASKASKK